jgi:hypothetical protein
MQQPLACFCEPSRDDPFDHGSPGRTLDARGHVRGRFVQKEEGRSFFAGVKEFIVEGAQEILENKKNKTSGAKIPVTGTIEDVKTSFWPTVIGFLKNAYWQALLKKIDDSVDYRVLKAAEKHKAKQAED